MRRSHCWRCERVRNMRLVNAARRGRRGWSRVALGQSLGDKVRVAGWQGRLRVRRMGGGRGDQ